MGIGIREIGYLAGALVLPYARRSGWSPAAVGLAGVRAVWGGELGASVGSLLEAGDRGQRIKKIAYQALAYIASEILYTFLAPHRSLLRASVICLVSCVLAENSVINSARRTQQETLRTVYASLGIGALAAALALL